MKGGISLKSFIGEVKKELLASVDDASPFFDIGEVELEVSFTLDIEAKGGVKFVVVNAGASTKASETHKVKLKLTPFLVTDAPPGGTPRKVARVKGHRRPTTIKVGTVVSATPAAGKIKVAPQAKRGTEKTLSKQPPKKDRSAKA